MSVDEQAKAAGAFVRGIVDGFGLDATTEVHVTEGHIAVEVSGEDLGLLVGPRGATLDALQELTRTVVQRRGEEHGTRLVVDVAGFRARRAAALESFTRRVVDEVLASGEPEALEPMSAADRKIVHDVVNGLDGVETTSEGTEPRRYVVIRPTGSGASAQ
ncbi:MAG: KH domain-containing protein [Actinomycetota bacterium]|nr:KH domain-containing protein [Actinomycetota bacterium]